MSYRSILVHLDNTPRCTARATLAASLAREHESHLVGLAPTGYLGAAVVASAGSLADPGYLELSASVLEDRARAACDQFLEQVQPYGLSATEALVDERDAIGSTIAVGRTSDLIVLGQVEREPAAQTVPPDFPQQVFMAVGRPVLVVPYAGEFQVVGRNVLVAWSDTREAARAMADAMPLLRRAALVHLCAVSRAGGGERVDEAQLHATVRWLARHGVDAKPMQEAAGIDVGSALLSRAADLGVDLIVMGGYGHSRLAEFVLGGVTRTMLQQMTVPVLLSH